MNIFNLMDAQLVIFRTAPIASALRTQLNAQPITGLKSEIYHEENVQSGGEYTMHVYIKRVGNRDSEAFGGIEV